MVDGNLLEEVSDPRIGRLIGGRYLVEKVLGAGGMATVYQAVNELIERRVAIKVMHDRFAADARLRERLQREAQRTAALAHPNIIEIYDFGVTEDGVPFLVMEQLHGEPLNDLLKKRRLSLEEVTALGLQLGRGLARAHDFEVVHRDIKPDNIIVCRSADGEEVLKIVDFGIALAPEDSRLTHSGQIIGSPEYMAPERLKKHQNTPASDLYSMGVVLFQMVCGRLPFESNNMAGFVIAHLEDEPPRPSSLRPECSPELEALILELLAKEPSDRPVDAHAVAARLESMSSEKARRVRKVSALVSHRRFSAEDRLEQWAERVVTFDEMVDRCWPTEEPPVEFIELLAELRATVGRLKTLRKKGSQAAERLTSMEDQLRETRERLNRALHVTGQDLSHEREAQRTSAVGTPAVGWSAAVDAALVDAKALHDANGIRPSDATLAAFRQLTGLYGEWVHEHAASHVPDLEFQLDTLRGQLEKVEEEARREASETEAIVARNAEERRGLESRLIEVGTLVYAELRPRPELADLFERLDRAG